LIITTTFCEQNEDPTATHGANIRLHIYDIQKEMFTLRDECIVTAKGHCHYAGS